MSAGNIEGPKTEPPKGDPKGPSGDVIDCPNGLGTSSNGKPMDRERVKGSSKTGSSNCRFISRNMASNSSKGSVKPPQAGRREPDPNGKLKKGLVVNGSNEFWR